METSSEEKNKRLRWGHILGIKKKWLDYIDEKQKIYIENSGDILKEKKHKQMTKLRTHFRDEKKWLNDKDKKQKMYIKISGDIFREKKTKD